MGNFFIPSLKLGNRKNLTCLFVGYALQDKTHINMCKDVLRNSLPINKMIDLHKDYKFDDKIDIIFVNGGFTNDLIEKLYKFKQFNKIKNLVMNNDAIYILAKVVVVIM